MLPYRIVKLTENIKNRDMIVVKNNMNDSAKYLLWGHLSLQSSKTGYTRNQGRPRHSGL